MKKKIYIALTILFLSVDFFSFSKIIPELLLDKLDEIMPVVVHFKGNVDKTYIDKYNHVFQHLFEETNKKLEKSDRLFLVVSKKELIKLTFDPKIDRIYTSDLEKYTTKKEGRDLDTMFMMKIIPYEHNPWKVVLFISGLFTVAHLVMGLIFTIRKKRQ